MATYPPRGSTPWDNSLRNYIDAGDAEAQTAAESTAADALAAHTGDTGNPHSVTALQVPYAGGSSLPAGTVETALDTLGDRTRSAQLPSDINLDAVTTTGSYIFSTAGSTVERGFPVSGWQGTLLVQANAIGNVLSQTATQTPQGTSGGGSTWVRTLHGSTWSPWREAAIKGVLAAQDIPYAGGPLLPASSVEEVLDALDAWRAGDDPLPQYASKSKTNTYTSTQIIDHPTPFYLERSSNGENQKRWRIWISNTDGSLHLLPIEDETTAISGAGFSFYRDGTFKYGGVELKTGTGSPLGVVSAPVGTRYVDTAATNGAREWYKDSGGGGNTGWIVTNGDTGWRDVREMLTSAWGVNPSVGTCFLRREGNRVTFTARLIRLDPSGARITRVLVMAGLTTSFLPRSYTSLGAASVGAPSAIPALGVGVLSTEVSRNDLYLSGVPLPGTWVDGDTLSFEISWLTDGPWPTSLPGTPA